jgi:flagellar motility protein MotE (MotC chaperone)
MVRILQSSWLVALIGGLLYLGTTAAMLRPGLFVYARAARPSGLTPNTDPAWRFRNPEFEQWVTELRQERETLSQREQQLRELQTRLEAERQELCAVTQTVHQLQAEFDQNVVRIKTQEVDNLKRQTKIITSMSPEGASAMLKAMPEDEAVRVLFTLKPDNAAQLLDALSRQGAADAKRAATFAERLRQVLPPSPNAAPTAPTN